MKYEKMLKLKSWGENFFCYTYFLVQTHTDKTVVRPAKKAIILVDNISPFFLFLFLSSLFSSSALATLPKVKQGEMGGGRGSADLGSRPVAGAIVLADAPIRKAPAMFSGVFRRNDHLGGKK